MPSHMPFLAISLGQCYSSQFHACSLLGISSMDLRSAQVIVHFCPNGIHSRFVTCHHFMVYSWIFVCSNSLQVIFKSLNYQVHHLVRQFIHSNPLQVSWSYKIQCSCTSIKFIHIKNQDQFK